MTDARQMNGQCRAPASCSENGNLTNGKLLLNGPVHHALPDAALGAGHEPSQVLAVSIDDDERRRGRSECDDSWRVTD